MPDEDIEDVYRIGTTDGLLVVPPTDERVDHMLEGTDLPSGAQLGRLGDREGILTVEKVAINAVWPAVSRYTCRSYSPVRGPR